MGHGAVLLHARSGVAAQRSWGRVRGDKLLYGLVGHGERVDLVEFNTGHGYPRPQREAVARWMRRWLLGIDDAPVEGDFPIAKDAALQCTRTGQVLEDFKGKSVFDLNAERAGELARQRAGRGGAEMLKEVERLLGLRRPVAARVQEAGVLKRDGYQIRKLVFETEPGIKVPGLLFAKGAEDRGPLTVYLHGEGKAAAAGPGGPIEGLVRAGRRVLALDVRGFGETAPGAPPAKQPSLFGVDYTEAYLALHLNRPLLGQRVQDVLAVLDGLAGDTRDGVHLVGVGTAGLVGLHAAALDPRVKELTLEGSLVSWSAVVRTPVSHNQLTNVVPGALLAYDLPELAAALAPRPLTVRRAVDPVGRPLTKAALEGAYAPATAAYRKGGAENSLKLLAELPKP